MPNDHNGGNSVADDTRSNFAVILLYPDYLQTSGHDTYIESVVAVSIDKAIQTVQHLAVKANTEEGSSSSMDPDDFAVLAVFSGNPELLLSNVLLK